MGKINIYVVFSIAAFLTELIFAIFVYLKGKRSPQNNLFVLAVTLTGAWCLMPFVAAVASTYKSALLCTRLTYIFAAFCPSIWLHFMFVAAKKHKKNILLLMYFVSLLFILFSAHPFYIKGINRFSPHFSVIPGPIYTALVLFFAITFSCLLGYLCKKYHNASGHERRQLAYLILSASIGIFGLFLHFLSGYINKVFIPHELAIMVSTLLLAHAIVKYRLMDIAVVFTQTAIFLIIFSFSLGVPFLLIKWNQVLFIKMLGVSWWIGPMLLMGLFCISGPFAYIYLKKKTEEILLSKQRRYQEVLKRAAVDLTRIRSLQKLMDFIVNLFADTVKITHSAIYVYDAKAGEFILKSMAGQKINRPITIYKNNTLVLWLNENKAFLVYEEVKRKAEDKSNTFFQALEKQMCFLKAAIVVPCFLENDLLDILILGKKSSGNIYFSEDLSNFSILAGEVALATENALLYGHIEDEVRRRTEELMNMQKQLVQAEKLATIGTLAGGVAHEINNPLTAILTNAQMLLADAQTKDPEMYESLGLIEEATKRCRSVVMKLMVFAKKPLEAVEFSKIDLANVVKNAVSLLSYQLEQDNIKIITKAEWDNYFVFGSQNELEQVIINIILNAKDAIKQAKESGTIKILLFNDYECSNVEIMDDGQGIPKDIMPKIFDPFFTTKPVGKGIGLGLSICQGIIEKHNGIIKVQSGNDKGSIFTIKIPNAKEEATLK